MEMNEVNYQLLNELVDGIFEMKISVAKILRNEMELKVEILEESHVHRKMKLTFNDSIADCVATATAFKVGNALRIWDLTCDQKIQIKSSDGPLSQKILSSVTHKIMIGLVGSEKSGVAA